MTEQLTGCTINSSHCKCLDSLTEEEKHQLEQKSVTLKYRKGEMIFKQGSFAPYILHLEKGLAKVFLADNSDTLVLKVIPPGNLLGLTSLYKGDTVFHYSAQAYIDTEVKQIDINFFRQLLLQNSLFAREVIDILISNSIQINGRFFCLTYKQSYGRLADILLCLADRIFNASVFELNLSRKELAELSGLSTETTVRMLKQFKEEKIIRIEGKKFQILDYDRLRKISDNG